MVSFRRKKKPEPTKSSTPVSVRDTGERAKKVQEGFQHYSKAQLKCCRNPEACITEKASTDAYKECNKLTGEDSDLCKMGVEAAKASGTTCRKIEIIETAELPKLTPMPKKPEKEED